MKLINNFDAKSIDSIQHHIDRLRKYWLETLTSEQAEIRSDDGLSLKAEILKNPEDTHLWVIIVHGYGWEHTRMYDYISMYAERGYQILMPDLRGCGESEGGYVADVISQVRKKVLPELYLFNIVHE